MKIGITGNKGFIGGSVGNLLLKENHDIVSLDDYTLSKTFGEKDKYNIPNELEWVLHFGASTSINRSFQNPFYTYNNNINSTLQALKVAHFSSASFIFMSSYVYGDPEYIPINEKHPLRANNPYMGSKIICEKICQDFSKQFDIPLIILRAFNIYGDKIVKGRLISDLIHAVKNNEPLSINDPFPKRDYLYIVDFMALIKKIISSKSPKIGTYNVGHGKSYSNLEVAKIIKDLAGGNLEILINSNPRANDIIDCTVDTRMIRKTFLWEPKYSLKDGLAKLI